MTPANNHACNNSERLIALEKKVTEVETSTKYINQELVELKSAIKECTIALNNLSNKISAEETTTSNNKWFIGIALVIAGLILGYFL